jgi:DNA polymerase I
VGAAAVFTACWNVDFEFQQPTGECPSPICMVAHELFSGTRIELFGEQLTSLTSPPYPVDASSLFVAYSATAELSCHLALNWPLPESVLDLYAEFRCLTNDIHLPFGSGIIGASHFFGLSTIDAEEKEIMRDLAIRGGPYTEDESKALVAYCASDVEALARLYRAMRDYLDLPRALLRGRYLCALATVESRGVPIDTVTLTLLRKGWEGIRHQLIETMDEPYGFYQGGLFVTKRFEHWLNARGIAWPRLPSGKLCLDDETFRSMSAVYPSLGQVRELRRTLATMRTFDLVAGRDGRSRVTLMPWRSKTGRNQPSNSRFVFGLPIWMRGLLNPGPGRALSYVDWSQQEFGIAAALSGDVNMMTAYATGDPYLAFAKQAGAVPPDATKATHAAEREQFKACALAVQYGMGDESLALRIKQTPAHARALLAQHRRTYRDFWAWSDRSLGYALTARFLQSSFGWTIHLGKQVNERSLRNFPMQANGSEMMRIACALAVEAGVQVCATVHDAFLIEARIEEIEEAEALMQSCMAEASRLVLNGFELRSDTKRTTYPDRYLDDKGKVTWQQVMSMLAAAKEADEAA